MSRKAAIVSYLVLVMIVPLAVWMFEMLAHPSSPIWQQV